MKLTRSDFDWAVKKQIIDAEQSQALWQAFTGRTAGTAKFDFVHLAYYAGATLVILAMGWFLALNWDGLGSIGTLLVSAMYGLMFWVGALLVRKREDMQVLGGLLATLAVCTVPVMTYSLLHATGLWFDETHFSWMVVNTSTVLAGLLALRFIRFPFMTAPIAMSLYNLAVDATSFGFGFDARSSVTILYGAVMLLVAYGIDLRRVQHRDFAFWMYLFGSLALFVGIETVSGKTELIEFGYAMVFVCMMLISILLQRRTVMVFGALGAITYIFHLSWNVFHDSALFPLVLVVMGVSCLASGVVIQKHREELRKTIFSMVPPQMRSYLPQR